MKTEHFLAILLIAGGCISGRDQSQQTTLDSLAVMDTVALEPEEPVKKDNGLDALALFTAGLAQVDSNSYGALEKEPAWQDFRNAMDSDWNRMFEERIGKMEAWQTEHFSAQINDSLPVFYPFSGPDFLHVYYLYPSAPEYILSGLEPVMAPPAIDTLSIDDRDRFLDSLGNSLGDILKKSFFLTRRMAKDLVQEMGVLPILYFFIERTGHELLEQEFIYLDTTSFVISAEASGLRQYHNPGVRLTFRDRITHKVSNLMYFSLDLSNQGLETRKEFERFVNGYYPFNTFVKSASYLMHRPTFTKIKWITLGGSATIFQDDSGISYADIMKTRDYSVQFYGEYSNPAAIFKKDRYQADLDSAYRRAQVSRLPFSLGYHWDTKRQNYMLFKKLPKESQR